MARKKTKAARRKVTTPRHKATTTDLLWVYVTTPSLPVATRIGRQMVEQKLAACANVLPAMTAIYLWKEQLHQDQEVVLILKTQAKKYAALESAIRGQHPYECPCIVALPVVSGFPGYLQWVKTTVAG